MKKSIVLGIAALAYVIAGCQQQQQKQQPVSYTPAAPPSMMQLEDLQRTAKQAPKDAGSWTRLGDAMMDAKRFSEAIDAYEKSVALDPGNPAVLTDLGTCYRGVGKFEKAVEQYKKALKIDPNFPNAHRNMGIVLGFDLGRKQEAIKEMQRYLELVQTGPNADDARQALKELSAR